LGSDFPYGRLRPNIEGLHDCGLDAGTLAAIEHGNALRLVQRLKPD
jgi:hypothetical protein